MVRLDKIVAGHYSVPHLSFKLKEAQKLIREGRVAVDGEVEYNPKVQIVPKLQIVSELPSLNLINPSILRDQKFYKMNKPIGTICQRHPTMKNVYSLIPQNVEKRNSVFCWGRLDRDTSGVLIFGTDGGLASLTLAPKGSPNLSSLLSLERSKRVCWKRYLVGLGENFVAPHDFIPGFQDMLESGGLRIDDGFDKYNKRRSLLCLPAKIEIHDKHTVIVSICEGFYHQVKRMIKAIGGEVRSLKRIEYGGVTLEGIENEGDWRELTDKELGDLAIKSGLDLDLREKLATASRRRNVTSF